MEEETEIGMYGQDGPVETDRNIQLIEIRNRSGD